MSRRRLQLLLLAAVVLVHAAADGCRVFQIEEATVDDIQLGFNNGSLTSRQLVFFYLDRIARLNPLLHAVIEVNPDALAQAARGVAVVVVVGQLLRRAPRRPRAPQGQHRDARPAQHDGRVAGAAGLRRQAGRRRGAAAPASRRGGARQGQPRRVGQLPHHPRHRWLERSRWPKPGKAKLPPLTR
uniref:OSJNBb0006L01.8 protein n=1 Tax=Oryza sativa subsp. japonica TaxID=39947 RepID=Q7XMY1_ORYSJ|nr:OSJNBb0006L01.8 [Oryza sativa Japonica Group]